jgi:hypothetical protein
MIFNWYRVINLAEFEATGLVSQEIEVVLAGIGLRTILVTKGRLVSIHYEGVTLSIGLTDANPFIFDGHAVYLHPTTGDIHLGILADVD